MPRTISPIAILAAVVLALLLGATTTAQAASPEQIFDDCSSSPTGLLQRTYARSDLRKALGEVTGDAAEYMGCYDAIKEALKPTGTAGRGGSGTDGGGDDTGAGSRDGGTGGGDDLGDIGGTTADGTTADGGGSDDGAGPRSAPSGAPPATPQPGSAEPVQLAGTTLRPGTIPSIGQDANELPTPLIVFLVLLGAGAAAAVATTIGRRVLARRRA